MARSAAIFGNWKQHNNKTVTIDGIQHVIKVSTYMARYPTAQEMISVFAEPKNKSTKFYQETRQRLGDDWSTDILDSDITLQAEVLTQLEGQS